MVQWRLIRLILQKYPKANSFTETDYDPDMDRPDLKFLQCVVLHYKKYDIKVDAEGEISARIGASRVHPMSDEKQLFAWMDTR